MQGITKTVQKIMLEFTVSMQGITDSIQEITESKQRFTEAYLVQ